jgi:hypothetical protein
VLPGIRQLSTHLERRVVNVPDTSKTALFQWHQEHGKKEET